MTRAEIIRMAQEWVQIAYRDADTTTFTVHNMHVAFAAGAAAERDACAKVAEKMLRFYTQAVTGVPPPSAQGERNDHY